MFDLTGKTEENMYEFGTWPHLFDSVVIDEMMVVFVETTV